MRSFKLKDVSSLTMAFKISGEINKSSSNDWQSVLFMFSVRLGAVRRWSGFYFSLKTVHWRCSSVAWEEGSREMQCEV